jgi:hypothetical protein
VEELISTLDVEERARTKDSGKGVETSTANVVRKRNFRKFIKKKNQNKQENTNKPVQTTQFKKKNNNNNKGKGGCFAVINIGLESALIASSHMTRNQLML